MKKISCLLLFSVLVFPVFSQVKISPDRLAFGTTTPSTDWVVDIIIENKSGKKDFLLRTTFSHEYDVIASSKTLMPDSTITIRVKFKPRLKGSFSENIEFHFASLQQPIIFPVTADVQYLNPDDHLACPDFSRMAADCCVDNTVLLEVVNAVTGEPIETASIKIAEGGVKRKDLSTNKEGKVSQSMPIAYYEFVVSKKGFLPESLNSYVNHRKAYFRFELQPLEPIVEEKPTEPKEEPVVVVMDTVVPPVSIVESVFLPEDQYRMNNIVFLLDASSSMSKGDRMALMRAAMSELVKVLRPGDKITLISYNDEAKTILETTGGDQKEVILSIVNAMVADGNTAGAKGFKSGYSILKDEFIEDGNNQLIVVTDGAFQPEDQEEIEKLVKKSARKKIKTSIVGIHPNTYASENLQYISTMGQGSFVFIQDDADLQRIVEEIKKQSAR